MVQSPCYKYLHIIFLRGFKLACEGHAAHQNSTDLVGRLLRQRHAVRVFALHRHVLHLPIDLDTVLLLGSVHLELGRTQAALAGIVMSRVLQKQEPAAVNGHSAVGGGGTACLMGVWAAF